MAYPGYNSSVVGPESFLSASAGPTASAEIQKLGNGYVVTFMTNPPRRHPVRQQGPPLQGKDPDEIIDDLVNGLGAFMRTIREKETGEDWKDSQDRKLIRDGFRQMFPQVVSQIENAAEEPVESERPRHEQLVFETKAAMLEYLTKNL